MTPFAVPQVVGSRGLHLVIAVAGLATFGWIAWGHAESAASARAGAEPTLQFKQIGFYAHDDGKLSFLFWPIELRALDEENVRKCEDAATELSGNAEFYAYGLDFSKISALGYGPFPPHTVGYTWKVLTQNNRVEGGWPVCFTPVEGYSQPTYRLSLAGFKLDGFQTKQNRLFCIRLGEPNMGGGPQDTKGFWFKIRPEASNSP